MRHGTTGLLAILTLTLLTACGGGSPQLPPCENNAPRVEGQCPMPKEEDDTPQAQALFTETEAAEIRTLTKAGPPGETAQENDARRREQDRTGWTGRASPASPDALEDHVVAFSAKHDDVSLRQTILAKHGLIVYGAQDQDKTTRSIGTTLAHAGLAVVTTANPPPGSGGDGIYVRTDVSPSGSPPDTTATWTGLMLGADRASQALLQGDAALTYDFDDQDVTVNLTAIMNLDDAKPYRIPTETFADIAVKPDGTWALDPNGARYAEGRFAGPEHQEAVGLFWTPAMTGAFGGTKVP